MRPGKRLIYTCDESWASWLLVEGRLWIWKVINYFIVVVVLSMKLQWSILVAFKFEVVVITCNWSSQKQIFFNFWRQILLFNFFKNIIFFLKIHLSQIFNF